jgi:hypothetical protein
MDVLLAALPTLIIFSTLIGLFVWLGRNHRNTWGRARGQEPARKGPVVRDSTWMRGGGGGGGMG